MQLTSDTLRRIAATGAHIHLTVYPAELESQDVPGSSLVAAVKYLAIPTAAAAGERRTVRRIASGRAYSGTRVKWLLSGIIAGIGLAGPASAQLPPVRDIPREERLWLVQIAHGTSGPFPEESAQLVKACGDGRLLSGLTAATYYACAAKYIKPARYVIAKLHAAPSESSPVVASVFEERKVTAENQFEFTWTVELGSRPGDRLPWPDAPAAFDYGLHLAGVQRRGDWVRLLTSIPADGWLRITPTPNIPDGLPLYVYVEPLKGRIVDLSPLTAQWPNGQRQLTERGAYLIVKITGAVVEFRAEIPSDFACGDPVTDPASLPPTLRAPASEFFSRDGTPRFSETYTKGC